MSIIPEQSYPDKTTPASESYPYGAARNITTPGDGTGTPLEQAWLNDDWGFKQALLSEGGVIPSGAPDTAKNSEYLQALKNLIAEMEKEDTRVFHTGDGERRSQYSINQERVSLKKFGVVGDGVADDSDALENAIRSGEALDWLDLDCKITRSISATYDPGALIKWSAKGARVFYEGPHVEYLIRLSGKGVRYSVDCQLSIDASFLANKGLEVLSDSGTMSSDNLSSLSIDNIKISRVKRLKGFMGGDALFVRGGFSRVELGPGCVFKEVELPADQGVRGSVGVTGVTVTHYGINAYCKHLINRGAHIEKVFSSDLDYFDDQDGLRYICPKTPEGDIAPSVLTVTEGSYFKNCYGRSVKSQCMFTTVIGVTFERDEGLNRPYGGTEVDAQFGYLSASSLTSIYSNSSAAGTIVNVASDTGVLVSGYDVKDCKVYLEPGTVLRTFFQTYPRDGSIAPGALDGIKIFGVVELPVIYACNGDKNSISVTNFYVKAFAETNYRELEKSLVTVITSGQDSPFSAFVRAENNTTDDPTSPCLVRDRVPSVAMRATVSSLGNVGFLDVLTESYGANPTNGRALSRQGMIGKKYTPGLQQNSGSFGISDTITILAGATETFPLRSAEGAMVTVVSAFNAEAFANFFSYNKSNTVINKGAAFEVGGELEPETGTFRVWTDDAYSLKIKNTDTTNRIVTVFAIVTR